MNDVYVAEVNVPVRFTNVPADKQLNNTGDKVMIRLRANGSDLFSVKYFSRTWNLVVNVSQVELKRSRYFDRYYILANQLTPQINERFNFVHTVISLSPDTIFLSLENIVSKSIPVHADVVVNCKPQYMVYDSIVCSPSHIMVSGPASVIDTLRYISTVSRTMSNLDQATETTLPIVFPVRDKKVRYSETEVKVLIPIEQFTELSLDLPVKGFSDDTGIGNIRTFPQTVQLTYQVAVKDYKLVNPDMFILSAAYDPLKDKDKTFLKVQVEKSPDFIRISRIDPDKVEFIIQK